MGTKKKGRKEAERGEGKLDGKIKKERKRRKRIQKQKRNEFRHTINMIVQ